MERKTARLTLLIDPQKKAAFERLCLQQDRTASQVVRQLVRDYLAAHGVRWADGGAEGADAAATAVPAAAPPKPLRPAARTAAARAGVARKSTAKGARRR